MIPRDEIEQRRRAAEAEPFGFEAVGGGVEVRSGSGEVFRVRPDLTGLPSSCPCPDFRSGRAGTCKHVEAARLFVAGRKASVLSAQAAAGPRNRVAGPVALGGEVLVFDLETQRAFDEVAGRKTELLGLSLAVVWSYRDEDFTTYLEEDAPALVDRLLAADLVVGFNHRRFDLEVLRPYAGGRDLGKVRSLDLLEELTAVLGHRVSLDGCCHATLGAQKSGHGLEAIAWFRQGRFAELERYCRDDVRLTRDLFDHGRTHGRIVIEKRDFARGGTRLQPVPVGWARAIPPGQRAPAPGMAPPPVR